MATYTLQKDDIKTCPYNPNHKVAARRLQLHIVKCQRNAPATLEDCPFNALHKIPKADMPHHMLICRDGRQYVREMEGERERLAAVRNRPVVQRVELPPSSNDWDEEVDPTESKPYVIPGLVRSEVKEEEDEKSDKPFTIKSNIQIQCMKPAERKKYYQELNERAKQGTLPDFTHKTRPVKKEEQSTSRSTAASPAKIEDRDDPDDIRRPTINPFQGGGRGNPGMTSTYGGLGRGLGRGRGLASPPVDTTNVKRERSPDNEPSTKRFSPDLH